MDKFVYFRGWESCQKHADYLRCLLDEIDMEANDIIDALPYVSRARRRRMFRELDRLARRYDAIEAEANDVMVYARARFVEPTPVSMSYGCSYAI